MKLTKKCVRCKNDKELCEFAANRNRPLGIDDYCKQCWRGYRIIDREINREKYKQKSHDLIAERVCWLQSMKKEPCFDCGKSYEPYCMDFDHIKERGEKIANVSRMVLNNFPKEIILKEISKCDLVCVLCHNKRTYLRIKEKTKNSTYKPSIYIARGIKIINEFKNNPCYVCNIQYEIYNMQVDHIDHKNKIKDVCQMKGAKEKVLRAELDKCKPICALCHRKKSILEQQAKKYIIKPKKPKINKYYIDEATQQQECAVCRAIKNFKQFNNNQSGDRLIFCQGCYKTFVKD